MPTETLMCGPGSIELRDGFSQPFVQRLQGGIVDLWHGDQEFIAAPAGQTFIFSQQMLAAFRHLLQHAIADWQALDFLRGG